MKTKNLCLVLLLFLSTVTSAQNVESIVDSLAKRSLKQFNVAGFAIGIVKDGQVVYRKGFGVKSIKSKKQVNEHTNFAIASNSKAFTSAALALLVEEGKLKWTDRVRKIIPEFSMYDEYVAEHFNIQDLLTHRSGLGLGIGDLMIFPDGSDFTMDDILSSFQHFEPVSAFRTKFDYDNLLYLVAGEVVKRVSGMSFEDFISQRIFTPLQMDHTYAALNRMKEVSNMAIPHSSDSGELEELTPFEDMINSAAGGIYSNVDDICQWMLMHLNKGTYGENLQDTLFHQTSQKEMWKLHTIMDAGKSKRYQTHFKGYGLGWGITDIRGNKMVSHTGGLPGMLSKTVLIPDLDLGIVVLTNTSSEGVGVFEGMTRSIMDIYLDLEEFNWIDLMADHLKKKKTKGDKVSQKVWATVAETDQSAIDTKQFTGVYEDAWFGKVEIFQEGEELRFKSYRSPKLRGVMYYYQANTFALKWDYRDMNADAFVLFHLDENGKAQEIKMKGISPNIDFSFDFQDLNFKRVKNK